MFVVREMETDGGRLGNGRPPACRKGSEDYASFVASRNTATARPLTSFFAHLACLWYVFPRTPFYACRLRHIIWPIYARHREINGIPHVLACAQGSFGTELTCEYASQRVHLNKVQFLCDSGQSRPKVSQARASRLEATAMAFEYRLSNGVLRQCPTPHRSSHWSIGRS